MAEDLPEWVKIQKLERLARAEATAESPETPKEFETVKRYSVEDVKANQDKLYIFGDNTEGWGKGGQAIIRDEPNAFGISTKDSPNQFMSDDNFEANKARIDADIAKIKADGRPIVFPEDGIGTGRADLENKAPKTRAYLMEQIEQLKGGTPEAPKGPGRGTMYNVIEPNPKYTGPYAHYIWRTQYNYANSDITFDFTTTGGPSGGGNSAGKGTPDFMKKWNNVPVDNVGRLNINNIDEIAQQFADALTSGQTVNIAGHGNYTSTRGGFPNEVPQSQVDRTVQTIFDKAKELAGDKPFTGKVISGGQSGFDEAGIRVARNIGIPTEVNVQDYTWRDGSGEHVKEEVEFKARIDADGKVPKGPSRGTTYRHGPGGRPPVNGEQSLTRDELFMRDVQPKIDDYYADLAAGEPSEAELDRYLLGLEKENSTVPDDGAPLDLKSIDSNSMDEIDVKIETQAKLPKGIIRSALREIPAAVIVPFEQAAELGLRQLGYGGPVRKLIKYELAIFGASILWGLVGAGAKYATDIYGYQTTGVPQDKQKEPLYPEGKTPEQELTSKIDAALMGATIMSSMMKAAPSYWLDEWLLKRYPELYPSEDTPFKEGGWKTWFPQQGLVTTGAQKGLGGIRNMFGGSND